MIQGHSRTGTFALTAFVIVAAAIVGISTHLLLGLLSLSLAVPRASLEDRHAATALIQLFSNNHPHVRIKTVLETDRLATAAALDRGDSQLAILRSDASAEDGQTLAILRRDAAVFVAPGGSSVTSVEKLRGATVGLLDGRKLDHKLLDLILSHFGIPVDSVHREILTIDELFTAAKQKRINAVLVVAPLASKTWLSVYSSLRKASGTPHTFEVDEAAAIAREHPVFDTIDIPKGTFVGSLPAPGDDITTLSVSHRLIAKSSMPDWLAGEITREVLTSKPKLVALDDDFTGIEAPDTDDKTQALPIHPGAAAYLSGNLPSVSDQVQNLGYWLGLMASAIATLSAAGAAFYQRIRPQQPSPRVMRLLEIWLAVPAADVSELEKLEAETDTHAAAAIRNEVEEPSETVELRLVSLLVAHIREATQRRRKRIEALA